jgi:hypothetical protein
MVGRALTVIALLSGFAPPTLIAHPLHTTLTEMRVDRESVRVTVRVFEDDLRTALARLKRDSRSAAVVGAYVESNLAIASGGRRVALKLCGVTRRAELVMICLEGVAPNGVHGLTIHHRVLCETFDDQVNIVRVSAGSQRFSFVFTRSDAPKQLK